MKTGEPLGASVSERSAIPQGNRTDTDAPLSPLRAKITRGFSRTSPVAASGLSARLSISWNAGRLKNVASVGF